MLARPRDESELLGGEGWVVAQSARLSARSPVRPTLPNGLRSLGSANTWNGVRLPHRKDSLSTAGYLSVHSIGL
jgi:hypothetical protein